MAFARLRSAAWFLCGDPAPAGPSLQIFRDEAEETVLFVSNSSGEIHSGSERKEIPQTIKLNWVAIGPANRLQKNAGSWIVVIDRPVAKISNPQFAVHQRQSPRSIEIAV